MQDAPANNVMAGLSLGGCMSRSRKKHPITGITTAETEKEFKQQEHSRERAKVRDALRTEKEILPHAKEFGNPWDGPKDGKQIWSDNLDKAKRK
jgi:hypothetical protein